MEYDDSFYDPFWDKDPTGAYCILFPNKHALDLDEIKEIFSAFGKVLSVTCAGDEKGIRFVRYSTLEEAVSAIRAINVNKGHKKVRLVHHKNKTSTQDNGNVNNKKKEGDTNQKPHRRTRSPPSSGSRKANDQPQKQNFKKDSKNSIPAKNEISKHDDSFDDTASIISQSSSTKLSLSQKYQEFLRKSASSDQESVKKGMPALNTPKKTNSALHLESKLEKPNLNEDEIPDLIRPNTKKVTNSQPKQVILNAECITVGNIHSAYGPAYILHLFDQYDPIAITYMQVVPKTNIRYCHVYFKTFDEVLKVENAYDGQDLNGQKLVVISQTRLIKNSIL